MSSVPQGFSSLVSPLIVSILAHVSNKEDVLAKLPTEIQKQIEQVFESVKITSSEDLSNIPQCAKLFSKRVPFQK